MTERRRGSFEGLVVNTVNSRIPLLLRAIEPHRHAEVKAARPMVAGFRAPGFVLWELWWAAVDSNHLPPRYQHGALPVELAAQGPAGRTSSIPGIVSLLGRLIWRRFEAAKRLMAGAQGFEPWALGFGDRCSDQTELRPYRLEARRARGPAESNSSRRPKAPFRARLASC